MNKQIAIAETKIQVKKSILLLPAFLRYLVEERLEEFVAIQWKLSEEAEAPVMKFFAGMPEAERISVSLEPTRQFWGGIQAETLHSHIDHWVEVWRTNQLPLIATDQVVVEDIVISTYVRKTALVHFLPDYTDDLKVYAEISAEIDFFLQLLTSASMKAYVSVQNERMAVISRNALVSEALTHIGNWSWDIPTGKVYWSDELFRIFGLAPQSCEVSFELFLSMLHPDERELHIARTTEAHAQGTSGEYDIRIITATGEERILHCLNTVALGPDGEAVTMSGTCQDVSEGHRLKKSLEDANRVLQARNKELKAFNHIASHDLQEPLRKIRIFSDLILESYTTIGDDRKKELLRRICRTSGEMQTFIEDLSAFSRTSGPGKDRESVDLDALLREVAGELLDETKTLELEADVLPRITGIRFQLKQLLHNLLGNAVKYAHKDRPARLRITVSTVSGCTLKKADKTKDYLVLSFSDNGIGFNQVYATKIFEPFQRLHSRSEYPGSGVGLAICESAVKNHGGLIYAEGRSDGADFHVALPADLVQPI
ncbi:MAG: PAS domain-containing protein [Bacteroidetes bacterium]|nr:PAS domain-containing protein [Bacteroidota bacterium]